jgi:hypothetical protein
VAVENPPEQPQGQSNLRTTGRSLLSQASEPPTLRASDEFDSARATGLPQHPPDVVLDVLHRTAELVRDLLVCEPPDEAIENRRSSFA